MTDTSPICAPCQTSMRAEKNGVTVHYAHNTYQMGDLWKCPVCGHEIIKGFGTKYERPPGWKFSYERRVV